MEELYQAIRRQHDLQSALIRQLAGSEALANLAVAGIFGGLWRSRFDEAAAAIYQAHGSSPIEIIPFDELESHVAAIEREYHNFCAQSHQLALSNPAAIRDIDEINREWRAWVEAHNDLTAAYDQLKRSDRYEKLYRPYKPNRFGPVIDPTSRSGAFPLVWPPETAVQD